MTSISLSQLIVPTAGRIVPADTEMMRTYLNFKEAIPQLLTMKDWKKKRTRGRDDEEGNQDGFMFGIIVPKYAAEIYFTIDLDYAYDLLLNDLSFELVRNPNGGRPLKKLIHVSDLDRAGMSALIEKALIFAAEHGVFIPDPDKSKARR